MLHLLLPALLFVQSKNNAVDSSPIQEARKALKEDWFTRALNYIHSNPETLDELMSKQYAVLEGDMVLSTDRNAIESRWPTVEIPYVISPELASRTDDLLSAMAMVSEHTCVSFHKRTSERNYLLFKTSKGCASYVGFIGGEQPVFVAPQCILGNIVHEIFHALGFHHEHTRMDREQYIKILPHNIMTGMERNFKKHRGQTFGLDYDTSSIMHYGRGFFSANGLPTIVPKSDVKDMGQRAKMTQTDIKRVRLLYNCDASKKQLEKESKGAKKEEDANVPVMNQDVMSALRATNKVHIFANKPEIHHTTTTSPPSASRQQLNNTTRGQKNTGREKA